VPNIYLPWLLNRTNCKNKYALFKNIIGRKKEAVSINFYICKIQLPYFINKIASKIII
jgi:hypothetical protein